MKFIFGFARPLIVIYFACWGITLDAVADGVHREFCAHGELDENTCGCTCAAPTVLVGSDCGCPPSDCSSDFYNLGSADPQAGCTCYCDPFWISYLPALCTARGGVFNSAKCGCGCPAGKVFNSGSYSCVCSSPPDCVSQGKVLDTNTCACVCDPTKATACLNSGGTYSSTCTCGGCSSPKILIGELCGCPPHAAPGPYEIYDQNACKTVCTKFLKGGVCFPQDCQADGCVFDYGLAKCNCDL